jgi:transposase
VKVAAVYELMVGFILDLHPFMEALTMLELPDPRSISVDALHVWRLLAVRAVVDFDLPQADAAAQYGVSANTMSQWVSLYREQGEAGLAVQPQGRPPGSGRTLSDEQAQEIRQLVVDTLPGDHDIAKATWTRRAVAELIAKRVGVRLTLQGVGKYLRRWGLTPQKPARQAREQDPQEVREFVERQLPAVKERAEQEEAQLHFVDEVGVKTSDQIGTSYAPRGETPVQEVPKTHIEQDVISSVTPDGDLLYWAFPGTMNAEKFIDFLERLASEATGKIIVFTDRHPAHQAQAVEAWLEGRESQIEVEWLPRYSPEYNADEFLNNDLKQVLENEPMPQSPSDFRETICGILDWIASTPERVKGYFKQTKVDLGLV